MDAMSNEVKGLERRNTRTVVDAPLVGEKADDSEWIFSERSTKTTINT